MDHDKRTNRHRPRTNCLSLDEDDNLKLWESVQRLLGHLRYALHRQTLR